MLPAPKIFGFLIDWYYLFQYLAAFSMLIFGLWYYFKKATFRLTIFQALVTFGLLYILMIGGGRIVGFIEFYMRMGFFPEWTSFFASHSAGNFRWSGSLLAALLLFPFLAKKTVFSKKESYTDTFLLFDMLVLCFCVLMTIGKQACQFSGDGCYGVATTLPWGMYYPYGIAPNVLPAHPTPIYDSLFHLFFFIWLLYFDLNKKQRAGQTTMIYFIVVPIFYMLLEIIRLNPVVAYGVTLPQVVYGVLLLLHIFILKQSMWKKYFVAPATKFYSKIS